MQTPLGHFRINMIKYLETNVSGKGEKPDKIQLVGSHIKCVPYIRFCTERQQPGRVRGAAGPRPCSGGGCSSSSLRGALARRGGAERGSQGGPHGGAGSQVSPPLPFPSAQSPVPRPPKSPSPQRERYFLSLGPLKVYRSFPAIRAAGLCSSPIQAAPPRPRAGGAAELQSPQCPASIGLRLPLFSPSPSGGRRPRTRSGRRGAAST